MGEDNRHQMMQNLFGDQSEEEEEEIESEHESNRQPDYASDEGEGEVDLEGEGEIDVEKQGEAEVESEAELHNVDPDPGESEGERLQSSPEREVSDQNAEGEEKEVESEEQEEFEQGVESSRRWKETDSGSEENHSVENEDEEVDQARKLSRSPSEEKDQAHISQSAAEIRDVFGDSDEEEQEEYETGKDLEHDSHRSPMEDEEDLRPEDMVPDVDAQYDSEDNIEHKSKEKPVGPPLELEIPLRAPPAHPEKMNMIKVSNIMGIDPKPFDPKTYVEEDMFVTDESGSKKRIRLENNIVRWRNIRKPDGTRTRESNARFVKWSDGSLQLLIGNEVLDISVQEAQHDQAHLFLRHGKGILQSQGRLQKKMRFMPSSLSSNSHRLLTALVDSRHKKVYKVKNCITDIDPEREKEEKEKALGQTIRANEILNRKRERVSRKYSHNVDRGRQLSPGFLDDALDEEDESDYHESRRSAARRRFEEDLEVEAHAEKRIINAKRAHRDIPRKSSTPAARQSRRTDYSESEKEESEYETDEDEDEGSPLRKEIEEQEYEDEEYDEPNGVQAGRRNEESEEEEEPGQRSKEVGGGRKRNEIESDGDSPRKKPINHRKMVFYDSEDDE